MLGQPRGLAELRQGFGACQSFEFKPHGTEGLKLLMLRASPQGEETAPRGQFRGTWLDCQHLDSAFRRGKSRNGHARPPGVPKGRVLQGGTPINGLAGRQRGSSFVLHLASRGGSRGRTWDSHRGAVRRGGRVEISARPQGSEGEISDSGPTHPHE